MKIKFPLIISAIIMALMVSCIDPPEDLIAPKWDVDLNLPLLNKTLKLSEIIKTDNNPSIRLSNVNGSDSLYMIFIENLEGKIPFEENIVLPPMIVPSTFDVSGNTADGVLTNVLIFNPDTEHHLDTAQFKSGFIGFGLFNNSPIPVDYTITVPGFKHKVTGAVLDTLSTISAFTIDTLFVDIKDFNYAQLPVRGANDKKNYNYQAYPGIYVIGTATSTLISDIELNVGVGTGNMVFERVVGNISRLELPYKEFSINTGFGKDLQNLDNNIRFQQVKLTLNALTAGNIKNVNVLIDSLTVTGLDLDASGNQVNPFPLSFGGSNFYQDSFLPGENFNRVFDSQNSNINLFLLSFPEVINYGNKFVITNTGIDPGLKQVLQSGDSLSYNMNIEAPLIVSMTDAEYETIESIGLSDSERGDIQKANSASLTIAFNNSIPLLASAKISFLDRVKTNLFDLRNDDGTQIFNVESASVDGNGNSVQSAENSFTILLNKTEIEQFPDVEFIKIILTLRTKDSSPGNFGPFVKFSARDGISYKLSGSVNYRINPEDAK